MDRKKRIWFGILILLFAALFVFIIRMQHEFVNGGYVAGQTHDKSSQEMTEEVKVQEKDENEEDAEEQAVESAEIDQELPSVMYVTADQLNIRSGPGADYPIAGMVTLHEEVQIEEQEEDWVKISVNGVTGYVNIDYLAEEIEQ